MSTIEQLAFSGKVALVGMGIVFLGLIILIVIISLMGRIFKSLNERPAPAPAPAPAAAPVPAAEIPVAEVAEADQGELIAVITAALMAYEQNTGKTLVVRSVRRSGAWGRTGRQEQVYSRY
jgi:sodium pump decarboxylase gamma subunit